MKNKIKYRNRFYLMLLGAFVLVWGAISFGFARTTELKGQLNHRAAQLAEIQDAPFQLNRIRQELEMLEGKLGKVGGEESGTQLIRIVGNFSNRNNLLLHEFAPRHAFDKDGILIETQKITVKGSFKNSLLLLSQLEKSPEIGNLRSVSFESQTDMRSGKKELFTSYYLQSVQRKEPIDEKPKRLIQ